MKAEQQKQAQSLYFQTELSNTEIADIIGIGRRTLHYWIRQNNWDIIRQNTRIMPTALAGNCYLIMAKMQEHLLSSERAGRPATPQEVNALHRLTVTIGKLQGGATLNENLEMMTRFMDFVGTQHPHLTAVIEPIVDGYILHRAADTSMLAAAAQATTPIPQANEAEQHLDLADLAAWAAAEGSKNNNNTNTAAPLPKRPSPKATPVIPPTITTPASETTIPQLPTSSLQNTRATNPAHVIKGKTNNRAARRAQAQAAARQGRVTA